MFLLLSLICLEFYGFVHSPNPTRKIPLNSWSLSSSSAPFGSKKIQVNVPSTVIAGLVEAKAPEFNFDPFYGKNLDRIKDSWFEAPWTYETTIEVDNVLDGEIFLLCFDGLNFKANVWVNEIQVGSKKDLVGPFRHFRLDVTDAIKKKKKTETTTTTVSIRVDIYRANDFSFPWDNNSTDLAITFVDWNPHPPDYSMGLLRPVFLLRLPTSSPALTFEGPVVATTLNENLSTATLTISYVVTNWEPHALSQPKFFANPGIPGISILEKSLQSIPSGSSIRVTFDPIKVPIHDPKSMLWWPWQMGLPNMFTLSAGYVSQQYLSQKYGIREITSKLGAHNFLQFSVNGKPLLIRAAGWSPDMFLRTTDARMRAQFQLIRDMNLNTIRLEGKMERDLFWTLADSHGLLMIPGWCCCDAWQHWKYWNAADYVVARESMRTQARRFNIHPSVLAFMYSSDDLPPADVERMYLQVFKEEGWPNPTIASGSQFNSSVSGPTGVKMTGPYSWVPPVYWLEDRSYTHGLGGAFGFFTEGGPGESPLTFRSWVRTVPEDHLWDGDGPMGSWWSYHCANPVGIFRDLKFFAPPLKARYGEGGGAKDWLYRAQAMSYEGIRAFYEGYARNRHRNATGLVQWMLNNAWPSHWWHLYDWYLSAGAGYYGVKRANEDLHAMLSYTDGSVWIMNQVFKSIQGEIKVKGEIFGLDGVTVWENEKSVLNLKEDENVELFRVPIDGGGKFGPNDTFFVRLTWSVEKGPLFYNDYWLSGTMDVLNWKDTQYYRTGCSQFANFRQLESLGSVKYDVEVNRNKENEIEVTVGLGSDAKSIGFFVEVVAMLKDKKVDVTPVFWTDNWFTLRPGDKRMVKTILPDGIKASDVEIVVQSWNDVVCS